MTAVSPRVLMLHMPPEATGTFQRALAHDGVETFVDASCDPDVARAVRPDVVVIDIGGCEHGAGWFARRFARALPDVGVVLLSDDAGDDVVEDAIMAGAAGLLHRDISPAALSRTVCGVAAGQAAVPRSLQMRLLDQIRDLDGGQLG